MNQTKEIWNALQVPERKRFGALLLLDILTNLADIFFLSVLIWLIQAFVQQGAPMGNALHQFVRQHLILISGCFCLLYAIKNVFSYYHLKWQNKYAYQIASRISSARIDTYLSSGFTQYNTVHSSSQIMKISQIPIEFGHYVIRGALQAAGQFILILLTLSIILVYNIRLFSLLIFILLPPVLLVYYLVKRQIIQMRARSKDAGETMHRHLSEALRGYIESNVYGKKDYFSEKYIISQKVFNESLAQQQSIQTMPSRILEAFGFSAILLLMVLNQALYGSLLPLATAGVFVAAAYKILPAMVKLMTALSQMKTYRHSIPEIVRDTGERNSERIHFANTRIHSLECRNIYFKYKDQWVVENFSMKLQSGEMVCMSGVSGEGKTTVIHLLLGFLRPSKGVILLNEQIGKEPVFQLSSHVSYVQQSPFLINDTLAQNIVLGNEVDPVRLANILQITGLSDEWKLSGKTDTWKIKENGKDISGGQRQRIALARALYHDFDLLILDEPFSELDPASEIKLLRYLQHLAAEGKIILLITHNKESKSYCHKVVRLHESQEKSFNHFDSRVS